MDRGFAVLIMAVVGGCIALQAPINAGLGKHTGSFAAATISFAVGTVLLGTIVLLSGKAGGLGSVAHVNWYLLLGGALGAAYVFSALVLVSQIVMDFVHIHTFSDTIPFCTVCRSDHRNSDHTLSSSSSLSLVLYIN